MNNYVVICGQTGSGKSRLALDLAKKLNGAIINADSRQVMCEFPILSDIPTDHESVPHYLYGYKSTKDKYTYHEWCQDAAQLVRSLSSQGILPILTGGTGFYVRNLVHGFHDIPNVECDLSFMSREAKYELVREYDPTSRIHKNDPYRLDRSAKVLLSTGKPMTWWQNREPTKLLSDFTPILVYLNPPKEVVCQRCSARIDSMFPSVLDEVKNAPDEVNYKVIGYSAIKSYIADLISLEEAKSSILSETLAYAKRQRTWFQNQMQFDLILESPEVDTLAQMVLHKSMHLNQI